MNTRWAGLATVSSVFLRLALGISFLSAVADRFGLWGVYGQPNVAWGNYARFVAYTAKLNWFLPAATIPALAIIATAAETLFGFLLVLGWKTRTTALLSGLLLTTFALTMTMVLGVKAPLDLSVFSAAGGALLLATCANFRSASTNWSGRISRQSHLLVAKSGPTTNDSTQNRTASTLIGLVALMTGRCCAFEVCEESPASLSSGTAKPRYSRRRRRRVLRRERN